MSLDKPKLSYFIYPLHAFQHIKSTLVPSLGEQEEGYICG